MLTLREQRNFQFDFSDLSTACSSTLPSCWSSTPTLKTKIMEEVGMPQGKQKLQHENIFFKVGLSMIRTPWPTTTWRLVRCSSFSWRSVAGGRNRMCRTILGFGNYCSHYTYCQVFVLGMNVWVGSFWFEVISVTVSTAFVTSHYLQLVFYMKLKCSKLIQDGPGWFRMVLGCS